MNILPPDSRGYLAIAGFLLIASALGILAFVEIPATNHDLFNTLISQAVAVGFVSIINYYFGSSKGASENRDQLNRTNDTLTKAVVDQGKTP